MHEAGLARSIADALEGAGRLEPGIRIRLRVSGGHDDPDRFDASLRLHLRSISPGLESDIELVHVPVARLCAACGADFEAVTAEEPCPRCGGLALPLPVPERIEVELLRPAEAR